MNNEQRLLLLSLLAIVRKAPIKDFIQIKTSRFYIGVFKDMRVKVHYYVGIYTANIAIDVSVDGSIVTPEEFFKLSKAMYWA
jgi:hypothetical protein